MPPTPSMLELPISPEASMTLTTMLEASMTLTTTIAEPAQAPGGTLSLTTSSAGVSVKMDVEEEDMLLAVLTSSDIPVTAVEVAGSSTTDKDEGRIQVGKSNKELDAIFDKALATLLPDA